MIKKSRPIWSCLLMSDRSDVKWFQRRPGKLPAQIGLGPEADEQMLENKKYFSLWRWNRVGEDKHLRELWIRYEVLSQDFFRNPNSTWVSKGKPSLLSYLWADALMQLPKQSQSKIELAKSEWMQTLRSSRQSAWSSARDITYQDIVWHEQDSHLLWHLNTLSGVRAYMS